jgi:hypothetical protein
MRLTREQLQILEETPQRVALQEVPHLVIGPSFLVFGLSMIVAVILHQDSTHLAGTLVVVMVGLGFFVLGLCGLVRSTISVERQVGILMVKRHLGWMTVHTQYPAKDIKRIFEHRTGKGNGLRVELVDGRKKNLSLWTEYSALGEQVAALNRLIRSEGLDETEESVLDFVNEHFRRPFQLGAPIPFGLQDVNATSFFLAFEERFHPDLTALRDHWALHCHSENSIGFWLIACVGSVVMGVSLHEVVRRFPIWAGVLFFLMVFVWVRQRIVSWKKIPILVQDLVDAVIAGKWVKKYD